MLTINSLTELLDKYNEQLDKVSNIGVIVWKQINMHFEISQLLGIANDLNLHVNVKDRDDKQYPWEIQVYIGKYTLFALADDDELIKYNLKN